MKILIDGRLYNQSGVGRYIRNLIFWLQKIDFKNDYFILLSRKDAKNIKLAKNFKSIMADFGWYGLAEQFKLPPLLNKIQPDLVHFPHFNVPVFYSGGFIVTIHDLIHQHFSLQHTSTHDPITYKIKQLGYKKVFSTAVKESKKILTPSHFVKKQLEDEWGLGASKIIVTPEAVDDNILSIVAKNNLQKVNILQKFNIKLPYIFYVGNAHPHKNIEGLIKAFLSLRKNFQYLQLVLSGNDHYFWQQIKREYQHQNIIYTGFLSEEELVQLFKEAQVFVMPSFEEGFGIPVLEAMACGTPVVSSNAGSLPEVAGEAAIYFNPKDTENMIDKISQVLKDQSLKKFLVEKGKERVTQFSWQKLAQQTLEVYEK